MWSAEALLPVVGAAYALRFEPELGDWSSWKLWMETNGFLRRHQGGPEVQLQAGKRSANLQGHPHNLEENYYCKDDAGKSFSWLRSRSWSIQERGSSSGSMWVKTVADGITSRISRSIVSSKSCPC